MDNKRIDSIFPEKTIRTTGNDGTKYTSQVYSFEGWGTLSFYSMIFMIIFTGILAPFVSVIFLLLFAIYMNVEPIPNSHNVFGILGSIYMMIDIYNHWFLSFILRIFFDVELITQTICFNMALIITHLVLLLLGSDFYGLCGRSKFIGFIVIGIMVYFSYQFSFWRFGHEIPWFFSLTKN